MLSICMPHILPVPNKIVCCNSPMMHPSVADQKHDDDIVNIKQTQICQYDLSMCVEGAYEIMLLENESSLK